MTCLLLLEERRGVRYRPPDDAHVPAPPPVSTPLPGTCFTYMRSAGATGLLGGEVTGIVWTCSVAHEDPRDGEARGANSPGRNVLPEQGAEPRGEEGARPLP